MSTVKCLNGRSCPCLTGLRHTHAECKAVTGCSCMKGLYARRAGTAAAVWHWEDVRRCNKRLHWFAQKMILQFRKALFLLFFLRDAQQQLHVPVWAARQAVSRVRISLTYGYVRAGFLHAQHIRLKLKFISGLPTDRSSILALLQCCQAAHQLYSTNVTHPREPSSVHNLSVRK